MALFDFFYFLLTQIILALLGIDLSGFDLGSIGL